MSATPESPSATNGVDVRELSTATEIEALTHVFDAVWHPDPSNPPVSTDLVQALAHAGNYVAGAYVNGHLAGGSVAFFATPLGDVLHSHITGVSRLGHGHQVGYALKMHQCDWARALGIGTITWTFDPLVARNAYFNIAKLGAVPVRYHQDFSRESGGAPDEGDGSDRVLVQWAVTAEPPSADTHHPGVGDLLAAGAVDAVDLSDPDRPRLSADLADATADRTVVVQIPRDIEALRHHHPVQAARWRNTLRDILTPILDGPARDVSFLRNGAYVFGPATADDSATAR